MNIILTQDVPTLGYKGDILLVKPGYARNFLLPQGFAIVANETNRKIHAENMRQASHKIEQAKNAAQNLAAQLAEVSINLTAKVGQNDKIFGSINTMQIAQALKDKGFDIDRRKITLSEDIKTIGTHEATIDLHREVKAKVNVTVTAEE